MREPSILGDRDEYLVRKVNACCGCFETLDRRGGRLGARRVRSQGDSISFWRMCGCGLHVAGTPRIIRSVKG
jgi:hypothetical protein